MNTQQKARDMRGAIMSVEQSRFSSTLTGLERETHSFQWVSKCSQARFTCGSCNGTTRSLNSVQMSQWIKQELNQVPSTYQVVVKASFTYATPLFGVKSRTQQAKETKELNRNWDHNWHWQHNSSQFPYIGPMHTGTQMTNSTSGVYDTQGVCTDDSGLGLADYGTPNRTLTPIFWYQKFDFLISEIIFWYQKSVAFSDIRK